MKRRQLSIWSSTFKYKSSPFAKDNSNQRLNTNHRLAERCAKNSGPEWLKIYHIPDIRDTLL
ncbi:hypothetical protein C1H46_039000 [Malus baccata]|uniref:Uncharacterized protein n=1 Tax=Malus baccata TaxID=106549 RepID=A0A540KML6_MALBA|nr:hypothetical protein C1H46_039000 [Malus baccata]